jgi:hypothetical protein
VLVVLCGLEWEWEGGREGGSFLFVHRCFLFWCSVMSACQTTKYN